MYLFRTLFVLLSLFVALVLPAGAQTPPVKIAVNSSAFTFSPGNWTGDEGRGGSVFRQTWYPGAYFRVTWSTTSPNPTATLLLDNSSYGEAVKTKPNLTYNVDGIWTDNVSCDGDIRIAGLTKSGSHVLTVYFQNSDQSNRWGSSDRGGLNVVKVTGLEVDGESKAGIAGYGARWALIAGDSITEGSAANFGKSDNLAAWSYFVGQGLRVRGFEYAVSACGWSGWLKRGDRPADVPAYYAVAGSVSGAGGAYDDSQSRWNKIDARHSLLDARGHLSAHGSLQQEPALVLINYGTNDALGNANPSDFQASVTQTIAALRGAAPEAAIYIIVPFGQYGVAQLQSGLDAFKKAHPREQRLFLLDLGQPAANALSADGYWSGLHPNMRGHATFAAQILARLQPNF